VSTVIVITYLENNTKFAFLSKEEAELVIQEWGGDFTVEEIQLTTFNELFSDTIWKGWTPPQKRADTTYPPPVRKKNNSIGKGTRFR
jgi:hypothetical protein